MTQFQTKEEAGKFALEHGFRWMPGCKSLNDKIILPGPEKELTWVKHYRDSGGDPVWCIQTTGVSLPPLGEESPDYPDFDDPATLGCLRAQVQEKWGKYTTSWGSPWDGCCVITSPENFHFSPAEFKGESERDALLMALAAKNINQRLDESRKLRGKIEKKYGLADHQCKTKPVAAHETDSVSDKSEEVG